MARDWSEGVIMAGEAKEERPERVEEPRKAGEMTKAEEKAREWRGEERLGVWIRLDQDIRKWIWGLSLEYIYIFFNFHRACTTQNQKWNQPNLFTNIRKPIKLSVWFWQNDAQPYFFTFISMWFYNQAYSWNFRTYWDYEINIYSKFNVSRIIKY